jgi:hypothetical protein
MSSIHGSIKRTGAATPPINRKRLRRLLAFSAKYMRKHLKPLSRERQTTKTGKLPVSREDVERWVRRGTYTQKQQQDFLKLYDNLPPDFSLNDSKKIKSFVKEESYDEYKHARLINARCDEAKILLGPMFQLVSDEVMHHERNGYCPFIKFVPIARRPDYIMENLKPDGKNVVESDYSTYEASFTKALLQVEVKLYNYMLKNWNADLRLMYASWFDNVLAGINVQQFKLYQVIIEGIRQSGELCTSLGNGYANLLIHLYIFEEEHGISVEIVVEGDDALIAFFSYNKRIPTTPDYAGLGLTVKLVLYDEISHAGFCGLVFDGDDRVNISEPLSIMCNYAWSNARYANAKQQKLNMLLRCKALSYLHQYPGAPVIQSLALYGLRVTEGIDVTPLMETNLLSGWEKAQIYEALNAQSLPARPVPLKTRLLMSEKYGVSVETQEYLEKMFDEKTDLTPVVLPDIGFPQSWLHYGEHYCLNIHEPLSVWCQQQKPYM